MTFQTLFRAMFEEEWRLHSRLFGGERFAAFPMYITVLVGLAAGGMSIANVGFGQINLGLHLLVAFFGLHTGSIAFVGNDAIENVLADISFLIYSSRTLPVSRRKLLATFVVKDIAYYAGLFIVPIVLGMSVYVLMEGLAVMTLGLLLITLLGMFSLGLVVSMLIIGIASRGVPGRILSFAVVAIMAWSIIVGYDILAWTPLGSVAVEANGLVFDASVTHVAQAFVLIPIGAIASVFLIDGQPGSRKHTFGNHYAWIRDRLPYRDPELTATTLLDLHRSSGGVGKPIFSLGILFLVALFMDTFVTSILGVQPNPALLYGTLLSFSSFTTYNWLTQSDSPGDYAHLPVSQSDLLQGKTQAFQLLFLLVIPFYGVGLWVGAASPSARVPVVAAVVGFIIFVSFSAYLFAITVWFAGFDPNAFLFDTSKFAGFTVAVAVPTIPVLLLAFAGDLTNVVYVVLGVGAIFFGILASELHKRTPIRET